jgi:hypothetical protein
MKRIMLNVPRIQLKNFRRNTDFDSKETKTAHFSLILEGAVAINGIDIKISESRNPRDILHISHNNALADVRTLDVLLYEYLAMGMNEFLNEAHLCEVSQFLGKRIDFLYDSDLFEPTAWKDLSLRIPVDFVAIYGMRGRNGITVANVRLGHHLILWGVRLYPTFKPDGRIFDKRIIDVIEGLLARKGVRERLRYYAEKNSFDIGHKNGLVAKVKGCNQNKIPPVRFY